MSRSRQEISALIRTARALKFAYWEAKAAEHGPAVSFACDTKVDEAPARKQNLQNLAPPSSIADPSTAEIVAIFIELANPAAAPIVAMIARGDCTADDSCPEHARAKAKPEARARADRAGQWRRRQWRLRQWRQLRRKCIGGGGSDQTGGYDRGERKGSNSFDRHGYLHPFVSVAGMAIA
jgi:hypothetical protein